MELKPSTFWHLGITEDGKVIRPGLIVFTNDLKVGRVGMPRDREVWGTTFDEWFDVHHADGTRSYMNHDRVSTTFRHYSGTMDRAVDQWSREWDEHHPDWRVLICSECGGIGIPGTGVYVTSKETWAECNICTHTINESDLQLDENESPVWVGDVLHIQDDTEAHNRHTEAMEDQPMYVATINVPGYMPMDDDPPTFETPKEAWEYLLEERKRSEDDLATGDDESYSDAVKTLEAWTVAPQGGFPFADWTGTVYGDTPGYDGDHDLGLHYSVSLVESTWDDVPEELAP